MRTTRRNWLTLASGLIGAVALPVRSIARAFNGPRMPDEETVLVVLASATERREWGLPFRVLRREPAEIVCEALMSSDLGWVRVAGAVVSGAWHPANSDWTRYLMSGDTLTLTMWPDSPATW